jgi:hypothetical protein
MERRIFVGDLPSNCSSSDIAALLERMKLAIAHIYLPSPDTPTGIRRNFAIVQCKGDDQAYQSCLKVLHNCFWKGSKLRVEAAGEYYLDRLNKERGTILSQSTVPLDSVSVSVTTATGADRDIIIPRFSDPVIRLRKYRCQPLMRFGTKPHVARGLSSTKLPSCRHAYFGDTVEYDEEHVMSLNSCSPATKSIDSEIHTPPTIAQKKSSGVRRGFGTLLSSEAKCDSCVELLPAADDSIESENIPCLTDHDITTEALVSERDRYKALLLALSVADTKHSTSEAVVAEPIKITVNAGECTTGSQFANINEFKSIFHKEGGVVWADDTKLEGFTNKDGASSSQEDALFIEAERLGIDIRGNEFADGKQNCAPDQATLKFNFFEDATSQASLFHGESQVAVSLPDETQYTEPISFFQVVHMAHRFHNSR